MWSFDEAWRLYWLAYQSDHSISSFAFNQMVMRSLTAEQIWITATLLHGNEWASKIVACKAIGAYLNGHPLTKGSRSCLEKVCACLPPNITERPFLFSLLQ